MNLGAYQRIELKQEVSQQMVLSARLFELPTGAIDTLIEKILKNPEEFNTDQSHTHPNDRSPVHSFFPTVPSTGNSRGGIIPGSPSSDSSSSSESRNSIDGLFIPKQSQYDSPTFVPSEFLTPMKRELLTIQIPKQYKNARNFFRYLFNQREWIIKTLRKAYDCIGSTQREFIFTLDESKVNTYSLSNLASDLKISLSSVSRLLKRRYVSIKNKDEEKIVSSRDLLKSAVELFFSVYRGSLNEILFNEVNTGIALSDDRIADQVSIARRTVAKYRFRDSIPNSKKRQEEYDSGRTSPFQISGSITLL